MIREISLTYTEESFNGRLQFVIYPNTAHSIMDGRENNHRIFVWILINDFCVHLEQVAILGSNNIVSKSLNCIREIEEHSQTGCINTISGITTFFCCT